MCGLFSYQLRTGMNAPLFVCSFSKMETTVDESDGEGNWIAYRIKSGEIVYFINEKTKECKWPGVDGDGSSSSREPKPVVRILK